MEGMVFIRNWVEEVRELASKWIFEGKSGSAGDDLEFQAEYLGSLLVRVWEEVQEEDIAVSRELRSYMSETKIWISQVHVQRSLDEKEIMVPLKSPEEVHQGAPTSPACQVFDEMPGPIDEFAVHLKLDSTVGPIAIASDSAGAVENTSSKIDSCVSLGKQDHCGESLEQSDHKQRATTWEVHQTSPTSLLKVDVNSSQQQETSSQEFQDESLERISNFRRFQDLFRPSIQRSGYSGMSRLSNIDCSRFNGDKVKEWLFKIEQFYEINHSPPDLGVGLAVIHFDDQAFNWHHSAGSVAYGWDSGKRHSVASLGILYAH